MCLLCFSLTPLFTGLVIWSLCETAAVCRSHLHSQFVLHPVFLVVNCVTQIRKRGIQMKKCISRSVVCRVRIKLRSQQIGVCWRQSAQRFDQRAEAQPLVPDKSVVNVGSVGDGRGCTTGGLTENEQEPLQRQSNTACHPRAARSRPGMEFNKPTHPVRQIKSNAVQRVSKKRHFNGCIGVRIFFRVRRLSEGPTATSTSRRVTAARTDQPDHSAGFTVWQQDPSEPKI